MCQSALKAKKKKKDLDGGTRLLFIGVRGEQVCQCLLSVLYTPPPSRPLCRSPGQLKMYKAESEDGLCVCLPWLLIRNSKLSPGHRGGGFKKEGRVQHWHGCPSVLIVTLVDSIMHPCDLCNKNKMCLDLSLYTFIISRRS